MNEHILTYEGRQELRARLDQARRKQLEKKPLMERYCGYCGVRITPGARACRAHCHLPANDPGWFAVERPRL